MLFFSLFLSTFIHANVVNEYFQKIESAGAHVGYAIIREEFLASKNQFIVTTFTKTNDLGGSITESLKAYSTADTSEPISYQYTLLVGKKAKTIDAVVRKGILYATVAEDKSKRTLQTTLDPKKDVMFASSLVQRMLKKGLSSGKNYSYNAVSEEDGQVVSGKVEILEQKEDRYRVLNDFKQSRFYSYLNPKGVILETDNPITKLKTKWVSKKAEAVGDIAFPELVLKTLFGTVPMESKK